MWNVRIFENISYILIISFGPLKILTDTEFCFKANYDPVFSINSTGCPFGVLFPDPVYVDCLSTTDKSDMLANICTKKEVDTKKTPIQIQFIHDFNGGPIVDVDSCNIPEKCGTKGLAPSNWLASVRQPEVPVNELEWPVKPGENEGHVHNQTQRLFRHLLGLIDADEGPTTLRIVTLLKKSFQILGTFCDNRFVPLEFGQDIEQAFLFLLAESLHHKIKDVSIEDFRRIDKSLNDCLNQKKPFKFVGTHCQYFPKIGFINFTQDGTRIPYKTSEFTWSPDKYDIPIDVTWTAFDFVHGLCYGTFKDHVNSHHLYQQAIERLFVPEILDRWSKPTTLARQFAWDNFFSANIRSAIRNLEHCVQAAYYDAPFLHRLERMLQKFQGSGTVTTTTTTPKPRKRREVAYPLPKLGKMSFFCFLSPEQRDGIIDKYKDAVCD